MNSPQQFDGDAGSDPWEVSPEQVERLGDSALAHSLALYRRRLAEDHPPNCAFESSI